MTRLLLFASVIALGMGTALLHSSRQANLENVNADISQNTDGAFRDGLFLGKRAAGSGMPVRIPIGRWAAQPDRASFKAGYLRGYEQVVTGQVAR